MIAPVLHVPVDLVNPYNRLLAEGLAAAGCQCELWADPPSGPNPRKLLTRLRDAKLVHWHWLQRFYQGRRWWTFLARSGLFISVMWELRARRIPQVITIHNLLPHEREFEAFHRRMARVIGNCVDRLVVHDEHVVDAVTGLYGARQKLRVIPHPDYHSPRSNETQTALRVKWRLTGFPRWVIAFGGIRRYKQIERVIESANRLSENGIGLIVAGPCPDSGYERQLRRAERGVQVRWELRRLESEELSELLLATDAAVMLYAEGLTSGAAHLCLSHGRPIVTSNSLAFREMICRRLATCVDGDRPQQLVVAIRRALDGADDEWRKAVRAFRDERSPTIVGRQLAAEYFAVLSH